MSLNVVEESNGNQTIKVTLATDANGNITSTAADVATLINANGIASSLLTSTTEGAGTGLVTIGTIQLAHGTNAIYA